jgi:zinc protease
MNRPSIRPLILGLAACAGLAATAATAADASAPEVLLLPSPNNPLVAIRVLVTAGSQDDPKGKEGLAALTAALVAQGGTKDLAYDQVLARFYPMAASLDGSTRKELTVFEGEVHRDNLPAYADLITAMIASPRFAPEDFDRLKTEALDYLTKALRGADDEELGKAALLLSLYPDGHPYGHIDEGTVAGLTSITLDDVKAFHAKHYARSKVRVGVAGGADQAFADRLAAAFNSLPADGPAPPDLPAPPRPVGLDILLVEKPSADSTAISIGFPLDITRRDDAFYALAVANSYLGEHRTFNGKLMRDLRGKRGLNYGDYSYIEDFIQDGGSTFPVPNNPRRQQAFSIWIRPVPHDKAAFALRAALWELDRLVTDGIPESDFETTRDFLLNYSKLWVQTLSRRLGYAQDGAFHNRDDLVTELARRLPDLTRDDVNRAVADHLKSKGLRIAIVTSDAQGLADLLKSGKPTPLVYDTAGTPEDVLREDEQIARFPLNIAKIRIAPVATLFEK